MSKKYTARETKEILSDVLAGAFEHMDAVVAELKKLGTSEEIQADPNKTARAKVLTLTLVCINDIVHPAHNIAYQLFNDRDEILDICKRNHKVSVDKKLVPTCYCATCRGMKKSEGKEEVVDA